MGQKPILSELTPVPCSPTTQTKSSSPLNPAAPTSYCPATFVASARLDCFDKPPRLAMRYL